MSKDNAERLHEADPNDVMDLVRKGLHQEIKRVSRRYVVLSAHQSRVKADAGRVDRLVETLLDENSPDAQDWRGTPREIPDNIPVDVGSALNRVEGIVAHVAAFLNRDDGSSRMLWNILTALRGPDDEDREAKTAVTAVVRHHLGLECAANGAQISHDNAESARTRSMHCSDDTHFWRHARAAFQSLGLSWSSTNPSRR